MRKLQTVSKKFGRLWARLGECGGPFVVYFFVCLCVDVKGLKGEKGDTGRGSMDGMDTSGFPAGFVEGPQGPPGRQVSSMGPQGPPGRQVRSMGPQGPPGRQVSSTGPQGPLGRQVSSMLVACCCARADCCLIDC